MKITSSTRNFVCVLFLSFVFSTFSVNQIRASISSIPLQTDKSSTVEELVVIVDSFLNPLEKSDATGSLKILFDILPVGSETQENIKLDIQVLTEKLGFPLSHEFVGYRTLGNCQRYILIYFLSYHEKMPVAWEFTFYRPVAGGKWQMNLFRFNSDEIFEFISIPKIHFESIINSLSGTQPK
ncbi:MAG: hypothetical protein HQM10_06675 [Candidatus Riflebacteria bacterium]|nr:hypothetical protein [Candidatus Riflebacteria bacterium]